MSSSSTWASFTQDPRRPEAAGLRASDRDRDVVLGVLAEGYADGRLTKEEYDERAAAASTAKTLGELPPVILDLVPPVAAPLVRDELALATPEDLQAWAVRKWEAQRRQALSGFLVPTLICWAIWLFAGLGFPWPMFVTIAVGAHLIRVLTHRRDIIETELRLLEKKQRKALGKRRGPLGG